MGILGSQAAFENTMSASVFPTAFHQVQSPTLLGLDPAETKTMDSSAYRIAGAALAIGVPALYLLTRNSSRRHVQDERVLILGASSGVGHAIARQYSQRAARICVVARTADKVQSLEAECGENCIGQVADFTVVDDMVRVRQVIEAAWGGLDTIHVCAGVSALQPLMGLADAGGPGQDASAAGIQTAVDIAGRATSGNFNGPLVAALTFVRTSSRTVPFSHTHTRTHTYTYTHTHVRGDKTVAGLS